MHHLIATSILNPIARCILLMTCSCHNTQASLDCLARLVWAPEREPECIQFWSSEDRIPLMRREQLTHLWSQVDKELSRYVHAHAYEHALCFCFCDYTRRAYTFFCNDGNNRVRWKLSVYGQPTRQVQPFGWRICTNSDFPHPDGVDGDHIKLGSADSTTRRLKKSEQDSDTAMGDVKAEILHVRY